MGSYSQTKKKSNLFEFEKFLSKNLIIHLIKIIKNYLIGQSKIQSYSGPQFGNMQILKV